MKKLLLVAIMALMTTSVSMAVPTNPYSPDLATIQGMSFAWNGGGTTSGPLSVTLQPDGVLFSANLTSGTGAGDGWASMGIGYPWPTSPPVSDLSSFDGYSLDFFNANQSTWYVNLYMNTGWTDPPFGETDNFYQNGWVALPAGVSTRITLDFASADLYIGGISMGLNPVVNANHVTNFGFQIGGNLEDFPFADPTNPSNPDDFHMVVSPIPAPGAMLLGGIGVALVGWLRGRKTL